jgi:hypothetical protein
MTRFLQKTVPRSVLTSVNWYSQVVDVLEHISVWSEPKDLVVLSEFVLISTYIMILRRSFDIESVRFFSINQQYSTLWYRLNEDDELFIIEPWLRSAFVNCSTRESISNCLTDDVYLRLMNAVIRRLSSWAKHSLNKNKNKAKCLEYIQILSGKPKPEAQFNCRETHCPICMFQLIDQDDDGNPVQLKVSRLECGHCFHQKCISKWMEKSNTCPTCRSKSSSSVSRFPSKPFVYPKAPLLRRKSL